MCCGLCVNKYRDLHVFYGAKLGNEVFVTQNPLKIKISSEMQLFFSQ